MDKRKGILNIVIAVTFQVATTVMAIVVKRILIHTCGNDVNGINALYLSIIGILAVAELGIGTAITFCMYKPIVQQQQEKVAALYQLFRKIYRLVGGIVLIAGLTISPFIFLFARDYAQLDINLSGAFILMLISVAITYLFGADAALINAYKNNYITTAITSGGVLLQNTLQIIVLLITGSFYWYLVCRIISVLIQWIATEYVVRTKYPQVRKEKQKVDPETSKQVIGHIKAMFVHKIGALLVNTFDSVIISVFVGVVSLGEYSNYTSIMGAMTVVISLLSNSLSSVFGHLYAEKDKRTTRKYCEAFHLINFVIGAVFYLGFYAIADNLVVILFGAELTVDGNITAVLVLNGFVRFMRNNTLVFRDATGTFYHDRWKPLVEGVVNIVVSILLVKRIGVAGVVLGTLITNLLICHVIEPYVLYRYAFQVSPWRYYLRNYGMIVCFFAAMCVFYQLTRTFANEWVELLVNGCLSVGVSLLFCIGFAILNHRQAKQVWSILREKGN